MFRRIFNRMREKIRTRQYVLTLHAEQEMEDDGLTIFDVERIVLTGEISERQRDRKTGQWKYVIKGHTFQPKDGSIVAKFGPTDTLVVITVFLE